MGWLHNLDHIATAWEAALAVRRCEDGELLRVICLRHDRGRVKNFRQAMSALSLLFPEEQTFIEPVGRSASCHTGDIAGTPKRRPTEMLNARLHHLGRRILMSPHVTA